MTRRSDDDNVASFFSRKGDRSRAAEFAAMARRLEHEREIAAKFVEPLLRGTPREDWVAISERPDLQTVGALERLGNLFADTLTKDPVEALALAELAVAAAEGIDPYTYPGPIAPQLRAHAWKDLGKALRFLGRNREAVEAFQTAEKQVERYGVLAHDRAIVRFNLAVSFQELQRFEESRVLLAECKQIFDDHGDVPNVILCGLAEGVLLQRLRRFREAREVYLLLFASTKDIDLETRAALHHAIGICSIELGEFRDAEMNLRQASALHETLGQPIQVLKSERCLGVLFLRRGDLDHGVQYLRPIRREFLGNRMTEEAGLCGLDIVEGLLLLGRTSAAETLARKIGREFTAAGLNERAISALGYLNEAITANRASSALVTEVREFIVSLRTSPERDFAISS